MPKAPATPPAALERAVLDAATELLPGRLAENGAHAPSTSGFAPLQEAAAGEVWPLYHLGLDSLVAGAGLAAAQQIGWRALVRTSGRPVALADVAVEVASSADVRQFVYGPIVDGLAARADGSSARRTANAHRQEDVFEERLLQIPGIYVLALWEHHPDDDSRDTLQVLPPVAPGLDAAAECPAVALLNRLQPLARERLDDDATRAPPTAPQPRRGAAFGKGD
jgi:hypothetical protein